jgi:hypothetical protein
MIPHAFLGSMPIVVPGSSSDLRLDALEPVGEVEGASVQDKVRRRRPQTANMLVRTMM